MKKIFKYDQLLESLVDDKINLLKDLSLELIDFDYKVNIIKCSKVFQDISDIPNFLITHNYISLADFEGNYIVLIVYDQVNLIKYHNATYGSGFEFPNENETLKFKNRIQDFINYLNEIGLKYRSCSGGGFFYIIKFDKYSKF
jgi:hypothetical protein